MPRSIVAWFLAARTFGGRAALLTVIVLAAVPGLRNPVSRAFVRQRLRGGVRRLVAAAGARPARAEHARLRARRCRRRRSRADPAVEPGAARVGAAPTVRGAWLMAGAHRGDDGVRRSGCRADGSVDVAQRPALRQLHARTRRQCDGAVLPRLRHRQDRSTLERPCIARACARGAARAAHEGAVPLVRDQPRPLLQRGELQACRRTCVALSDRAERLEEQPPLVT